MSPKEGAASDERAPLLGRAGSPSPAAGGGGGGHTNAHGSWPHPAGLPMRGPNDENLVIFRRALGINSDLTTSCADAGTDAGADRSLEEGRKAATGTYRAVLRARDRKAWQNLLMSVLVWACHVVQVVLGAVLTALGPAAEEHARAITALGAANTVVAGLLALIKGRGWPERLRRDELEFRRCQDWIEETERLIAVGVAGRDRVEVGELVELAFKKYNAAKASEENNRPDAYVRQAPEPARQADGTGPAGGYGAWAGAGLTGGHDGDAEDARSQGSGNAIVRLNVP